MSVKEKIALGAFMALLVYGSDTIFGEIVYEIVHPVPQVIAPVSSSVALEGK